MSKHDMRTGETEEVDGLVVRDHSQCHFAEDLQNDSTSSEVFINSHDYTGVEVYVSLKGKAHAKLVIKAINHAIKLGWLDEVNDEEGN